MEDRFKEDQDRLLQRMKEQALAAIRVLGRKPDRQAVTALVEFTELFVFDPKTEVGALNFSTSFADHECWHEAAKALGRGGKAAIPELRRALRLSQVAVRYAAAVALGEIGPAVDREDKGLYAEISAIRAKARVSTPERTEKDKRTKLLQVALDRIRPPEK
jgi:PBS lyase HEAT-like repeat